MKRKATKRVMVGDVAIGGNSPISVQSMTNVLTSNPVETIKQIKLLASRGTEVIRVAVPDRESAAALNEIIPVSPIPLVADIHFDPELALLSIDAGVHKLRINPGNIKKKKDIQKIAEKAGERNIPIRIGVNSGSIPADLRDKYGGVNADSMWASAERHICILTETGFEDIVLSLKASDAMLTVEANRRASQECEYPLHLGVTEAGLPLTGSVRTATALSILLNEGIGDTLRVSLSGKPDDEPLVGWEILSSLNIRRRFPRIVSCPTCARCRIDVAELAEAAQEQTSIIKGSYTVAVMGCEVNGPGEAREAEIAFIGTSTGVLLFMDGKKVRLLEGDRQEVIKQIGETLLTYNTPENKEQEIT